MNAQQPEPARYGFSKTVDLPYAEAVEKTRAALKEEGFGVLCEIDIKEKLKGLCPKSPSRAFRSGFAAGL